MIHDLGFIRWKDTLSWMESMKGTRWNRMIEKENTFFVDQIQEPEEVILAKANDFENAKRSVFFRHETIVFQYLDTHEIEWHYINDNSKKYIAVDVYVDKNYVYQRQIS